jgi:phage terminase large subunit-like protein
MPQEVCDGNLPQKLAEFMSKELNIVLGTPFNCLVNLAENFFPRNWRIHLVAYFLT